MSYCGAKQLLGFVETVGTNPEILPPPTSTLLSTFLVPHNPDVITILMEFHSLHNIMFSCYILCPRKYSLWFDIFVNLKETLHRKAKICLCRNLSHSYFFCWHFTLIVVSLTVVHPIYSMIIILAPLHLVIWVFGLIGNWCCIICLSFLFIDSCFAWG